MTPPTTGRGLLSLTAGLALLMSLTAAPGAQAAPGDDPGRAASDRQAEARAVLDEAQRLFSGTAGSAEATGRDASMVLRDLYLALDDLSAAERARALSLAARPAKPASTCNDDICVHYSPAQVDTTDADTNGIPDYIDFTLATVTDVHDAYIAAGYREPLPDGTHGGDSRIDIYIDSIGPSIYGYCTTDPDGIPKGATSDTWAYCVLDNDYSPEEFETNTPPENLQVTAAHEYFHATQYAYDFNEDHWLLESTATWMEDEMYDDVDDNLNYFSDSSLTRPKTPLDSFGSTQLQYGNWIFWRYLTEQDPTAQAGLPTLVRDVLLQADNAAGGPDRNSLQSLEAVLGARGKQLPSTLADYHATNRAPRQNYEEGKANKYPKANPAKKFSLSRVNRKTGQVQLRLDHLSSATARFTPQGTDRRAMLSMTINMADTVRGSAAIVSTKLTSGAIETQPVKLNARGNARLVTSFGKNKVKYVELTLVNASNRYRCDRDTEFTCAGVPKDDKVLERFWASLTR